MHLTEVKVQTLKQHKENSFFSLIADRWFAVMSAESSSLAFDGFRKSLIISMQSFDPEDLLIKPGNGGLYGG